MSARSLLLLCCLALDASAQSAADLVADSLRRQAPPPFVYQEQTLVLSNAAGQNTVRTARYYARHDKDGTKRLLVIQTPSELRGASVFVERDAQGGHRRGPDPASALFGSDFSVADFEGEQPRDFVYELVESQDLDRVSHHVLLATPLNEEVRRTTGYGVRRLFLRKDNLFVSRIEFLDRNGHVAKRRTFRDPRPDESGAWRPSMILTEDLTEGTRTLIKIERRVHSPDYVPADIFAGLR